MNYFDSDYWSNSDLKSFVDKVNGGNQMPENIEEIYRAGTLNHAMIFQPHLIDWTMPQSKIDVAKQMRDTFMADKMLRQFISMPDFRTEHEWYRNDFGGYGVKGRMKADGDSKALRTGLEFKGLAVSTKSGFDAAIDRLKYDQGVVWYMDGTGYDQWLIACISKSDPKKLFKILVDKNHDIYKAGRQKVNYSIDLAKQYVA